MAPSVVSPPIDKLSCRPFSCFSLAWSSAIVSQRLSVLETVTAVLHGKLTCTRHDRALRLKDASMPPLVPSARVARWRSCVCVLGVLWVLVPLLVYADQCMGTVVGLLDGDTISVLRGGKAVKVRLLPGSHGARVHGRIDPSPLILVPSPSP